MLQTVAAGGRQLDALLASAEQRQAQYFFELFHARRDGGLADEQMLGRRIDRAQGRSPVEGF
ncbi:hypothetical protein D9M69_662060 [compost metagenome]